MFNGSKLTKAFHYAFQGISHTFREHQNMKIHLVIGIAAIVLGLFLGVTRAEMLIIIMAIFFVFFAEMVNTSIEEMTDLITQEHRREAKIAKDVAAASVLLAAAFAVIVGLVIFLPYILEAIF